MKVTTHYPALQRLSLKALKPASNFTGHAATVLDRVYREKFDGGLLLLDPFIPIPGARVIAGESDTPIKNLSTDDYCDIDIHHGEVDGICYALCVFDDLSAILLHWPSSETEVMSLLPWPLFIPRQYSTRMGEFRITFSESAGHPIMSFPEDESLGDDELQTRGRGLFSDHGYGVYPEARKYQSSYLTRLDRDVMRLITAQRSAPPLAPLYGFLENCLSAEMAFPVFARVAASNATFSRSYYGLCKDLYDWTHAHHPQASSFIVNLSGRAIDVDGTIGLPRLSILVDDKPAQTGMSSRIEALLAMEPYRLELSDQLSFTAGAPSGIASYLVFNARALTAHQSLNIISTLGPKLTCDELHCRAAAPLHEPFSDRAHDDPLASRTFGGTHKDPATKP